jgi:hypothetical protein
MRHVTFEAEREGTADAALRYAWHGWPIAPGVRSAPSRRGGWPAPLAAALPYRGPLSTNDVVRYWHHHAYPVLLATGFTVDVFAVRQPLAGQVLKRLEPHGPVAVLPGGCWLFLVEAGEPPAEHLLGRDVRWHGAGSWVPLPPTRLGRRPVTWHVDPASVSWRLFRHGWLQAALRPAVPQRRRPDPPPDQAAQPRARTADARHHTLLVAGDRATFQATYPNQGPA